jgi:hypothetical protein
MTVFQNVERTLNPDQPAAATSLHSPVHGVITGRFCGFNQQQMPLVAFAGQPGTDASIARTTVDLAATPLGAELVLQFEQGDVEKPIVLGVIRQPESGSLPAQQVEVDADNRRLLISAQDEIVLRCGDASITLTRAGKVLIKGTYLSSRATGTHRIKGGSVQIN